MNLPRAVSRLVHFKECTVRLGDNGVVCRFEMFKKLVHVGRVNVDGNVEATTISGVHFVLGVVTTLNTRKALRKPQW